MPSPLIYERLSLARRAQRLTQADLGKILSLPQGYISEVENEKHDIKISTLEDWARVLGFELMLIPKASVSTVVYVLNADASLEQPPPAYAPLPDDVG
jgi:transcriptional regulator with XRE-family HTH domain